MMKNGKGRVAKARPSRAVNARLRTRVLALLAENPAMKAEDMALELKVSRQRVQAYMTRELRAEAEALNRAVAEASLEASLEEVDRAMLKQARLGNVQAARLVYMRMAQKGEAQPLPSLEELEAELASLKKMEHAKRENKDDAGMDADSAVADDACR